MSKFNNLYKRDLKNAQHFAFTGKALNDKGQMIKAGEVCGG